MEDSKEELLDPLEIMSEYCSVDEVEWYQKEKIKNDWNQKNPLGLVLFIPYVTSTALQERLDKAYGPCWSKEMREAKFAGKDNVLCTITVRGRDGKVLISRDGVGVPTDIEPAKGAASDAFKRAGWHMGFGRDLRSYPVVKVQLKDQKWIPNGLDKCLAMVTEMFILGVVGGNDKLVVKENGWNDATLHWHKSVKEIGPQVKWPPKDKQVSNKPTIKYSVDIDIQDINKALYKGTGVMPKSAEDYAYKRWLEDNATIYHQNLIYTPHKDDPKVKVWFRLNGHQLKKFKNG